MIKDAQRPVLTLPIWLLVVMAIVSVWAVPVHAQTGDDPPTVTIVKTADELTEGSSALVYRLEADPAPSEDLLVRLELEQVGSSVIPALVGRFNLTIPAGQSTLDFGIPTINDATDDADGSMTLSINTFGTTYQVGDGGSATVTIVDDDEPITYTFADLDGQPTGPEIMVYESVGTFLIQIVATVDGGRSPGAYQLDGATYLGLPLTGSSTADTATGGEDYRPISANVLSTAFLRQESGDFVARSSLAISIIDDDRDEGVSEQFELTLEPGTGADHSLLTLPSEPLRIVIIDDDPADQPGTVFFNWTQPHEGRRFPAYLSDPDSDLSDKAWQWSRADTDDGPFTVIDGATDSDYTPQSSDVGKYLKVTVTYSDGHGTGKSAEAVSQRPVRRRGC